MALALVRSAGGRAGVGALVAVAVVAASAVLSRSATSVVPIALPIAAALVPAAWAAWIDVRAERLPNALVVACATPALASVAVALAGGERDPVTSVAFGAIGMGAPLLAIHLLQPTAIGFGDVKLAAALGASLGLLAPALVLGALCVGSATTVLVAAWRRRSSLPFGPGLVTGAVAMVVYWSLSRWEASPWR